MESFLVVIAEQKMNVLNYNDDAKNKNYPIVKLISYKILYNFYVCKLFYYPKKYSQKRIQFESKMYCYKI